MALDNESLLGRSAQLRNEETARQALQKRAEGTLSVQEAASVEAEIIKGQAKRMRDMVEPAVLLASITGVGYVKLSVVREDDFDHPRYTRRTVIEDLNLLDRLKPPYPEVIRYIRELGLEPVLQNQSSGDDWGRDYTSWTEFGIRLPR